MKVPRCLTTAVLLANGDVLITGGLGIRRPAPCDPRTCLGMKSAEIYNPKHGTFERVGDMLIGRFEHTATLLKDDTVLIAGGTMTVRVPVLSLTEAEIYDPSKKTFSRTGQMQGPREGQSATLLKSGDVLIHGGETGGERSYPYPEDEVYNSATREFTLVRRPPP